MSLENAGCIYGIEDSEEGLEQIIVSNGDAAAMPLRCAVE